MAERVTATWTKTRGVSPADVRVHVQLCREQGDEAGAAAFLALGRDDWWVPLYSDPSPATAARLLAAENDDERRISSYRANLEAGFSLSRLLDVARLVPERREAALDRFVERATALITRAEAEDDPLTFDRLLIPYGWLAHESLDRARALVDAHPRLLTIDGGMLRRRRWGATSFMAALLAADFDLALSYAPKIVKADHVWGLTDDELYDLALDAEQWFALARALTTVTEDYGYDSLLGELAYFLDRSWRSEARNVACALAEAREEPDEADLHRLIGLGRHDEARVALATMPDDEDEPEALSPMRFILGLDDLDETIGRMAHGRVQGEKAAYARSHGRQIEGLVCVTELVSTHTPDDAEGLAKLEAQRTKLIDAGPEDLWDNNMWGSIVTKDRLARLRALELGTPAYAEQFKEVVSAIRQAKSDQRRFVASAAARSLVGSDPAGAVALAKMVPPQSRSEAAVDMTRAFLPLDPGGALIALCSLCPKQPHLPSELLDGAADILRAIYL